MEFLNNSLTLSRNERVFEELCKDGLLLIESWRCMGRSDLFESIWCELVTTNHRTLEGGVGRLILPKTFGKAVCSWVRGLFKSTEGISLV